MTSQTFTRCIAAAQGVLSVYPECSSHPPVDVENLARKFSSQVIQIRTVGEEFSGLVSPAHKLIGVNGNHSIHRQRFTIAHELGHIFLKHPPESRCTVGEIMLFNREADTFASELLIPTSLLTPLLEEAKTESTLCRLFDVSKEAMTIKIKQCRTFSLIFP